MKKIIYGFFSVFCLLNGDWWPEPISVALNIFLIWRYSDRLDSAFAATENLEIDYDSNEELNFVESFISVNVSMARQNLFRCLKPLTQFDVTAQNLTVRQSQINWHLLILFGSMHGLRSPTHKCDRLQQWQCVFVSIYSIDHRVRWPFLLLKKESYVCFYGPFQVWSCECK